MATRIRLARGGRKKRPYYHIVVADSQSPRDGRFIERIGSYNPLPEAVEVKIDSERLQYWLQQGAKPSETVNSLIRKHAGPTVSKAS
jgi:small subunit ribosomal protein S16